MNHQALEAVERLQARKFIAKNAPFILARLEKTHVQTLARDAAGSDTDWAFLLANRPILQGVSQLGSSPTRYRDTLQWAATQLPQIEDPSLALDALTLAYIAEVAKERLKGSRSSRRRTLWRGIENRIDRVMKILGSRARPQFNTPAGP